VTEPRPAMARARDVAIRIGSLEPGQHNAITDVQGVRIGHATLIEDGAFDPERGPALTGVTVVLPHADNLFKEKVPAAFHIVNGFGKATGSTQVNELGVLETPIALTNTLSVGSAFEGLVRHALGTNPEIGRTTGTVNPVVAECSDARLNDIRALRVRPEHVLEAIDAAAGGRVEEGSVGAGTGMTCYGWKGGIGTASRVVGVPDGSYTIGVLVLANFGQAGDLRIADVPVGKFLRPPQEHPPAKNAGGACVIVLATSAPVDSRQLGRLARRGQNGLARTGTFGEHGSGEYVIAFSTARRVAHASAEPLTRDSPVVAEDGPLIDLLFRAVTESTEEAVVNALVTARHVGHGPEGAVSPPLPLNELAALIARSAPH
jgi:D-aminopeptidase